MAFDARLLAGISLLDAIVEAGGFARAGDAVGLTPSGVSRAVARLEERVGARLFDRNARRVTLTVTAANTEATRLYERCGFQDMRRFLSYVWEAY